MSAKLLQSGASVGHAFVPFTIPAQPGMGLIAAVEVSVAGVLSTSGHKPVGAEQQARTLLETARAEAAQLLADAQAQAAQIEQEAYEKGWATACAQAQGETQMAVADLRGQLAHTLTELAPLYTTIAARAERDLVKLALEIARKVIHREVSLDADIVLTLARVALERLHPRAIATVRLHPDDFAHVNAQQQSLSGNRAIEIVADQTVGRGGCIVQSEHGDIDARIEQQLASLERGFFE